MLHSSWLSLNSKISDKGGYVIRVKHNLVTAKHAPKKLYRTVLNVVELFKTIIY
jgi:hypothetical protein